jgi:microcystin-dependent protein
MASSYSTSLKLELIGNGDQSGTWGTTTNNNLGTLVEQAITGVQAITMSNANYTLTNYNGTSDEARNAVLVVSGTNSAIRQIIIPTGQAKLYVVKNSTTGGYAITIGAATGSTVTIPNGITAQIYYDGSNCYSSQTGSAGDFTVNGTFYATGSESLTGNLSVGGTLAVTGTTTFTGVPSGPTAATGTNTTQLATTAFVQANSAPTGGLIMWGTGTAPTGWLLCDGTAVNRTTYAALFAVISTTFGVGDGSTTFNLPNYTNRMPYGTTVGTTGGTADAIVVSHSHSFTGNALGTHNHTMLFHQTSKSNNATPYMLSSPINGENLQGDLTLTSSDTSAGTPSGSISTTGSSGTNQNLPPYLGINFIIKT